LTLPIVVNDGVEGWGGGGNGGKIVDDAAYFPKISHIIGPLVGEPSSM